MELADWLASAFRATCRRDSTCTKCCLLCSLITGQLFAFRASRPDYCHCAHCSLRPAIGPRLCPSLVFHYLTVYRNDLNRTSSRHESATLLVATGRESMGACTLFTASRVSCCAHLCLHSTSSFIHSLVF